MRLALYSDLHLEFPAATWHPPALDVDVVILAGDIDSGARGIDWAARTFGSQAKVPNVIYVAGNHEYYGGDIETRRAEMREAAKRAGVHFLDNDAITVGNVRFLGATLWSDFAVYGSVKWTERSIEVARTSLSDYALIRTSDGTLTPEDTVVLHRRSAVWLETELRKPFDGKTVVITHFAPHRGCIAPQFDGDVLTPYFTVDMASFMRRLRIDLWAFGHTHHNVDFEAEGGCRVVSNQRGYPDPSRFAEPGFRPELVIEL
jgi:predicted phosphohydrolase